MSFNGWPHDVQETNKYWCRHSAYGSADLAGKRNIFFEHEGSIQDLAESLYTVSEPQTYITTLLWIAFNAISALDLVGVDPDAAWDQIVARNMTAYIDTKDLNRLGLPLIKDTDQTEVINHAGNIGELGDILNVDDINAGC